MDETHRPFNGNHWRVALLDLDGTLYRGDKPIDGADRFVERLRQSKIRPAFVTNNSMRTPREVVQKLASFGIKADTDEVFTSSQMAARVLQRELNGQGIVAALGKSGLEEALRSEGLDPVMARSLDSLQHQVSGVVVGLDVDVTYQQLAWICHAVMGVGKWILTNADVRLPHGDSFLPGNGAIGRLIEATTGIRPTVVGKPNPAYIHFVLAELSARPEDAVVIGDNLATDIAAAVGAQVDSIFVETGVSYSKEETVALDLGDIQPTYTARSVADLLG